jgi:hypothetical protein
MKNFNQQVQDFCVLILKRRSTTGKGIPEMCRVSVVLREIR